MILADSHEKSLLSAILDVSIVLTIDAIMALLHISDDPAILRGLHTNCSIRAGLTIQSSISLRFEDSTQSLMASP